MRQPLSQITRRNVANVHTVPAPVGGWNARDAVANMPETDAIILDNYFPTVSDVRNRHGYEAHATCLSGQIESLMPYTGPVTTKLIAATGGYLYDTSSSGAITPNRTNLITYSEQFDNAAWTKSGATISVDAATDPDGDTHADEIIEDSAASVQHLARQTVTATAANQHIFSAYVKRATGTRNATLQVISSPTTSISTAVITDMDAETCTVDAEMGGASVGACGITDAGSGWYRIWAAVTLGGSDTSITCDIALQSGTSRTYTGDGSSSLYIYGAQLEAVPSSYSCTDPTAYIETTSSSASDSGDEIASGFSEDRWQHVMFGTAAGSYLCIVNGTDAYRTYDGTTLTAQTLTGVPEEDLIHVNAYKQRLFFVEKDSLSMWYLAAASISGTATKFDVGPYARRGGYLVATSTWTIDGGDGPDDYLVCITSEGEAIVWTGTDPGDATAWSLVGSYRTGKPIGRRCFERWGGELILITEDGYMPMSSFLRGQGSVGAVSDKIRDAVTTAVRTYRDNFGWQAVFAPHLNMMLFNVPTDANGTTAEQHVLNTITGAWCRYTDIDSTCYALYGGELYFGGTNKVYRLGADLMSDASAVINTEIKPAFNYFGRNGNKRLTQVRPVFSTNGTLTPSVKINVDYDDTEPSTATQAVTNSQSYWDTAPWDTSDWGGATTIQRRWLGATGIGYAATMRMKASTKNISYGIQAIDYMYESGGWM